MTLKSLILSLTVVGAMAMPLLYAAPAQAQATRTWVSGVGSDANPCSRTAPCKTWAGAISKTAPGGEIDALDPGGYGALTITKSITLDGGGGQVASTLTNGTNGIVVAGASTDVVVIRNVRFQGVFGNGSPPSPGLSGIVFQSGKALVVDNCDITGFSVNGITVSANAGYAGINNTRIQNVGNAGIVATDNSNSSVDISNTKVHISKFGIVAGTGTRVSVANSVSSDASTAAFQADQNGNLLIDTSVASFSATGVSVNLNATVAIGNSDISFNTQGIGGGGTGTSYVNNRIFANGATNALTPIAPNPSNPSGQK
jgi:hypothetical protein